MTKTTLRDHHKCPGHPIDTNLPVKRRIKKEEPIEPKIEVRQPTDHDKLRNERIKKRSESISKLAFQVAQKIKYI